MQLERADGRGFRPQRQFNGEQQRSQEKQTPLDELSLRAAATAAMQKALENAGAIHFEREFKRYLSILIMDTRVIASDKNTQIVPVLGKVRHFSLIYSSL